MGLAFSQACNAAVRTLECDACADTDDASILVLLRDEALPSHWLERDGVHLCWHCRRAFARSARVSASDREAVWRAFDAWRPSEEGAAEEGAA